MQRYTPDLAFRKWLLLAILVTLIVFILSLCAQAQSPSQTINWKPLLQEAYPQGIRYTPRYSIAYESNGFDSKKRKIINKKTPRYFDKMNAAHLVEPFQIFAIALTENSDNLPQWIDEAWDDVKQKWLACGGVFAQAANNFNPSRLLVVIEAQPFWVEAHKLYANGMVELDGRTIRAVNIATSRLHTDPQNASLVFLPDLLRWEIGNSLQLFAFGYPRSIADEIGSRSPCGG